MNVPDELWELTKRTHKAMEAMILAQTDLLNFLFENIQPGGMPEDYQRGMELRNRVEVAKAEIEQIGVEMGVLKP